MTHASNMESHQDHHEMNDYLATKARRAVGMLALLCLALMLCTYTPQSRAACVLGKGIDKNVINIALGSILVPTNEPVSLERPFAEGRFPIRHEGIVIIECDKNGGSWIGAIHLGAQVGGTNRIYRTSIPGIGIRIGFRMWDQLGTDHFPFSHPISTSRTSSSPKWAIHVELFKTERNTGNGALDEGLYATMYTLNAPQNALQVVLSGRATTITTPSCTAAPTPPVKLGKVWKNLFGSVGSTAAEQSFSIKLNCREAKPELNTVYLRMDAKPDASGSPGVIALTPDANAATGVGIQILDQERKPVVYGQSALVGVSKDGVYTVPFHARYYQTANQVTAGVANGSATFTLEYK